MPAQVFGLDIGRSFVKVAKVKVSGKKKFLEAAASIQSPAGGIMSESPVDLKKLADSIKKCVDEAKIGSNKCAVSLLESQVVTRLIELPPLTDKELSAAINWEAEQYIPLPIKDVNLQYKVVSRPESSGRDKMQVLLVAAPLRVINKYLNVAKEAGLTATFLESESFALSRALTKPQDPVTIIISMGAVSTELVITYMGSVLFSRSVATGGINLTRAIMAEFNLPQDQAEQYKLAYGILEDKLSGKVAAVLKPILDVLVSEILKATEFAHSILKDSETKRSVVCGGSSFLPGIIQFLAERTSLEVSFGDPWQDFEKQGQVMKMPGQGSVFAVATGLALRN
ncbi:MAG TPA: type IV pilus assembly protein PilM [Patescibacteria group bacterium]|nr:type IV pilus assembly protein PilM [Patescibacteria group bacterium]